MIAARIVVIATVVSFLTHFSDGASASIGLDFLNGEKGFSLVLANDKNLRQRLDEALVEYRSRSEARYAKAQTARQVLLDRELLNKVLRSEGYYQAKIEHAVTESDRITYYLDPGPLYRIARLRTIAQEDLRLPDGVLSLKPGDPLRAKAVLNARDRLVEHIKQHHCLYRIDVNYEAKVFHENHTAELILRVAESPQVVFGEIDFDGLTGVQSDYLLARTLVNEGDCFKRLAVDRARLALLQTNLLAGVSAEIGKPQDNRVPVTFKVQERHHRTMSAGLGFQSDEGFGISLGWEHRNFRGRGQILDVDTLLAENAQSITTEYSVPHFRRDQQTLTYYAEAGAEQTDAFDSQEQSLGIELSRQISSALSGSIGIDVEFSEVEEDEGTETFGLVSVPITLRYDRRDAILDPRRGYVAAATLRPYFDTRNEDADFTKSTIAASYYYTLDSLDWQPTLAVRSALGTIRAAALGRVPANERFYVGGGGSVRGYAFQSLGNLTEGEPDGGLSFSEFSLEARLRLSEDWGAVLFSDGGWAGPSPSLDLRQLRWSAGLGIRYFTSFAPIRFDLAVPLDQRVSDDDYQIYLSIGQAF